MSPLIIYALIVLEVGLIYASILHIYDPYHGFWKSVFMGLFLRYWIITSFLIGYFVGIFLA